jgi:hypothetical protein
VELWQLHSLRNFTALPNGDRWTLQEPLRNTCRMSPIERGIRWTSETDVNVFLSIGGHGPEYQASAPCVSRPILPVVSPRTLFRVPPAL